MDQHFLLRNHGIIDGAPSGIDFSNTVSSPRLIKSHLPASLLPQQVWKYKQKVRMGTCPLSDYYSSIYSFRVFNTISFQIIYVARNCKDVVISSYHFTKNLGFWKGDHLEDYVNDFMNNEVNYSSYWSHIVDFWKMRQEPFIFFVTYEEMKRDLTAVIQRLCTFLERPQLTAKELAKTLDHLSFAKMSGKFCSKKNLTTVINI